MYVVYCIFSTFSQYYYVPALHVAFPFSIINGFESWNYGFVSCTGHEFLFHISSDFILKNTFINNTETVRCEMNIRNLTQTGLNTAECTTHFII
jgi:hypothetical protein